MGSEIEWIIGALRAGNDFEEHGDLYDFSCTVIRRGNSVELVGGSGRMTPSLWKEIKQMFLDEGIEQVTWDRQGNLERMVNYVKSV